LFWWFFPLLLLPNPQEVQEDWVLLHKLNFFQYLSGLETYLPNWANDAGWSFYSQ